MGEPTRHNFLVTRDGLHEVCVANRQSGDLSVNLQLRLFTSSSSGNSSEPPLAFGGDPSLDALGIASLLSIESLHNDITLLALDLNHILDELRATRMRLNQRREISERTNRSVLFVSVGEVVVTLVCASLQIVCVRRLFFKK